MTATSVLLVWHSGGTRHSQAFPLHAPEWRQTFRDLARTHGARPQLRYLHSDRGTLAEVAA